MLQHSGSIRRSQFLLRLAVAPDSGEGELSELAGSMTIEIKERKHFYTFDYRL